MAVITYVGLKGLDSMEADTLKGLTEKEAEKIDFILPKANLKLHVKTINAEGNARIYKIKVNADSTKGSFEVDYEDWDLKRTIHKVFNELGGVIKKRLKIK